MSNQTYVGFVVNIFNSLNYDIHIEGLTTPYHGMEYSYVDEDDGIIRYNKTHRCRLSGILRKKSPVPYDEYIQSVRSIQLKIQKLNGWVMVKIIGEDKFRRLLVELYDLITGQSLNDELRKLKNVYIPYN